jgi:hypothetical protein
MPSAVLPDTRNPPAAHRLPEGLDDPHHHRQGTDSQVAVIAAVVVGMGGVALAATSVSKSEKSTDPHVSRTFQPTRGPAPSGSAVPKPPRVPSAGDFTTMCHDIVSRIQQQRTNPLDDPSLKAILGQDSQLWEGLRKALDGTSEFSDLNKLCDRIAEVTSSGSPSSGGSTTACDAAARCRKVVDDIHARQAELLKELESHDLGTQNKALLDAIEKAIKDALSDARLDDICNRAAAGGAGASGSGNPS